MNIRLLTVLLLLGAMPASAKDEAATPAGATRLSHGRFHDFLLYSPKEAAASFVLYLSPEERISPSDDAAVRALSAQGALVAAVPWPAFKSALEADGAGCVFPDGDLENLSHFAQAYAHNATYLSPILVGRDATAALAYAMLVQAPRDTFAAALTVNFCPELLLKKPLCKGSGIESTPLPGEGARLSAAKSLGNPWVNIDAASKRACPIEGTREFLAGIRGAAGVISSNTLPPLAAAFGKLAAADRLKHLPPAPTELGDLPVVLVPAQAGAPTSDVFAILMSGDGGWAGLDQDVAAALSAKGIPVVGLDSLRYYWTARTPETVAQDTDRLIRYYQAALKKTRALLIGYSQGADVLPFALNRLPPGTRKAVALAAILGMSEHAVFEFHLSSWISDSDAGPLTLPEVNRISGVPLLCVYGADESDSLCPKLDPQRFKVVKMKGGHHFDGDYAGLAREILNAASKPAH